MRIKTLVSIGLISGLCLAGMGCASGQPAAKNGKTLYERVGGMPAIKALVIGTKDRIVKDPRVNVYFAGFDLDPIVEHFIQLACVATGGPCKYQGRSMKETHKGMHITNAAFDAVMEDIMFTAKKLKVKQPEQDEIADLFNGLRKDIVEIK
jgi:hemoglobin